ncbi:MAG: [FeFe] hydrogenase H-cluster maturation GTPase HydF [Candidatus Delongbacteria bacterium]|jgi:[FeFe] hydrogenase H-cluster maturation GTPase HydF|nr:[FeFe] hydrogenase H-cluster maturation GTPase HydF [Candidatus Delongbacteria bacterium]
MAQGRENKVHIGIYGRRNNGKSSLINSLAGQEISIVSNVAGTTTDPVKKSIEITGVGPVILIDTAGIDDIGELGSQRIRKSFESLKLIDLAILVLCGNQFGAPEKKMVSEFNKLDIPYLLVHNKSDKEKASAYFRKSLEKEHHTSILNYNSLKPGKEKEHLISLIRVAIPESAMSRPAFIGDVLNYGDIVLLITPIDIEAPEGRMILPQVQAIRDIIDNDAIAVVMKEREVDVFLKKTGIKPALAITDSQIFLKADAMIPKDVPLTGFSIVLARYKGDFSAYLKGTPKISELQDGDKVLLLESCTHQVSCDDIGRVKIPRWISDFTGKNLNFDVVAGLDRLPNKITDYALVIQCGGCVITRRQLINRIQPAIRAGVPVTNYGMAIAWVQGVYNRAVEIFVDKATDENYL